MRKILLDLNPARTVEWIHDYLAFELELPEYSDRSLDALYEILTEWTEDTCIGVFCPPEDDSHVSRYLQHLCRLLKDAERDNEHLAVIFGELEENYEDVE